MRVSYFPHPLIEGINKDGSDTEKDFLGEGGRGSESRLERAGSWWPRSHRLSLSASLSKWDLSGPEHRLDGLEAVGWTR